MIPRIAALILSTCLLASAAVAEPVPIEQLKKDFDSCVASCPEAWEAESCTNYCRCVNAGVQRDFTLAEYENLVEGFTTDAVADEALLDRFFGIVDRCRPAVPELTPPQ